MKTSELQSPWARWAFVGLSAMWAMAGWMILLAGEFTKTYRYSPHSVRVDGPAAVVMACIFFLLSLVAAAVVLQSLGMRRSAWVGVAAIIVLPPAVYLIA